MCDLCQQFQIQDPQQQHVVHAVKQNQIPASSLALHISQLYNQLQVGSNETYDYSEPLSVGGPGQPLVYQLASPFNKTSGIQYHVDTITSGAGTASVLVSGDRNAILPGYTSSDTGTVELTPIKGTLAVCPENNTLTLNGGWYDLVDSNGIVYVIVSSSQAVYVTIQLRKKR